MSICIISQDFTHYSTKDSACIELSIDKDAEENSKEGENNTEEETEKSLTENSFKISNLYSKAVQLILKYSILHIFISKEPTDIEIPPPKERIA